MVSGLTAFCAKLQLIFNSMRQRNKYYYPRQDIRRRHGNLRFITFCTRAGTGSWMDSCMSHSVRFKLPALLNVPVII